MGSIFETAMLVCFGFSWPMNVMKAYRARTAKGTSLAFILLIITGYVAGILAKLINNQINYVLVVYLLNLAIVLTNVAVYFRNRKIDRSKEAVVVQSDNATSVVLFGNNMDKEIPVAEIAQDYEFKFKMFNRSSSGLSLSNAKEYFTKYISPLNPESVMIHIGENDLSSFAMNCASFDLKYLDLISFIRSTNHQMRIALVGNKDPEGTAEYLEMNRHIKAIAESEKCDFIDLDQAELWNPEGTKELMSFMYDVGFDRPLNIKKPLGDIAKVLYSYAYKNGLLNFVESKAI